MRPYQVLAIVSLALIPFSILSHPNAQGLFLALVAVVMSAVFFLIHYRSVAAK